MGKITGERSVEIDGPIQQVFDIAADIEGAVDWMGSMKRAATWSPGQVVSSRCRVSSSTFSPVASPMKGRDFDG